LVTTVCRNVLGVITDSFVIILLDNAWPLPALLVLQGTPVKKVTVQQSSFQSSANAEKIFCLPLMGFQK
jgi:hypothetical protein